MNPPAAVPCRVKPQPVAQRGWSDFLAPRFWPGWAGIGLLWLLHRLPWPAQRRIGVGVGRLFRRLARGRVHVARTNIRLCFPDWPAERVEALVRDHFDALGIGLMELNICLWGADRRVTAPLWEVTGVEHLERARREGRGVLLLTGHFTTMEMASATLAGRARIGGMYRPLKNPLFDWLLYSRRAARTTVMIEREDLRGMIRCLRAGAAVWYGFDQNYGGSKSVFVDFFAMSACTIATTSRLARMGDALVIPYFPCRLPDGRYRLRVQPPLEGFPGDDEHADTRRLNQILERAVLECPEQYLWIHRRFKTRPPGEPGVY